MKLLTLVRHAQAEAALGEQSDFDRVLTRRGAEDAAEMARRLKQRKLRPDLILSSPAPRARATAEIFARILSTAHKSGNTTVHIETDDRLYTAGLLELLTIAQECKDTYLHVLIAAHNPGITEFADRLSHDRRIDSMPTCAVVTMRMDIGAWSELNWECGLDVDFDYPARA